MSETIDFYNKNAREYCMDTRNADMSIPVNKFLSYIKPSANILDVGCGSGRDSMTFLEAGFNVVSIDASPKMCQEAEKYLGKKVRCIKAQELDYNGEFDGVWACASLLHIPKKDFEDTLAKLRHALKSDGIIYASFKKGNGEKTEDGRFFSFYEKAQITELFEKAGFEILEIFENKDSQNRADVNWINLICKKV